MIKRFVGGTLLVLGALPLAAQGVTGILKRDQALSHAVRRNGLRSGLEAAFAAEAVLVYPGAPVIIGRDRAIAFLAKQPVLDSLTIAWTPAKAWISKQEDFAISIGTGTVTREMTAPSRPLGYIAAWQIEGGTWRLAALMLNGVGGRSAGPELPKVLAGLAPVGAAAGMIEADLAFSALAGKVGASEAFRGFAAPDAVNLGAAGARRGPDEIAAGLAGGPPSEWNWFPVAARSGAAGDLGFTVGQAVITPREGGEPTLSKYLTAWARQSDGRYKFISDGGNARPAP
jgi:hypothetical protein